MTTWRDRISTKPRPKVRTVTIPEDVAKKLDWLKDKVECTRPMIISALVELAYDEEGGPDAHR